MLIDHQSLRKFTAAVIGRMGSEDDEAELVADHLVLANLSGHDSHGVGLIPNYVRHFTSGLIKPNTADSFRSDRP